MTEEKTIFDDILKELKTISSLLRKRNSLLKPKVRKSINYPLEEES